MLHSFQYWSSIRENHGIKIRYHGAGKRSPVSEFCTNNIAIYYLFGILHSTRHMYDIWPLLAKSEGTKTPLPPPFLVPIPMSRLGVYYENTYERLSLSFVAL